MAAHNGDCCTHCKIRVWFLVKQPYPMDGSGFITGDDTELAGHGPLET